MGPIVCLADPAIELKEDIEGVRVEVKTGWFGKATFDNEPESKTVALAARDRRGEHATFQPARRVIKLWMHLRCEAAENTDDIESGPADANAP